MQIKLHKFVRTKGITYTHMYKGLPWVFLQLANATHFLFVSRIIGCIFESFYLLLLILDHESLISQNHCLRSLHF